MAGFCCHGKALSFCSPAISAGHSYQFSASNFGAEVLRHAIGVPLQLNHRGSHRCGTVTNVWTESWALLFTADLDGEHADEAMALLDGPGRLGVSVAPVFAHDGERVTSVNYVHEISLTPSPACKATYAVTGADDDEPRPPWTWWTGAPPLPPGLSASALEALHLGQLLTERMDAIESLNDRLELFNERIT